MINTQVIYRLYVPDYVVNKTWCHCHFWQAGLYIHEIQNFDALKISSLYYFEVKRFKCTVKPVFSGHSKRRPKIVFQDPLSLNAGQKYCRMLQESILQYFRLSLSYHLTLKPLFCLLLSGRLRQILLYCYTCHRCSKCFSYYRWEESRSRGRQAELAYCNKNFLNRKTLLEIQVCTHLEILCYLSLV